jgi:hypothetical protein
VLNHRQALVRNHPKALSCLSFAQIFHRPRTLDLWQTLVLNHPQIPGPGFYADLLQSDRAKTLTALEFTYCFINSEMKVIPIFTSFPRGHDLLYYSGFQAHWSFSWRT